MGSLMNDALGIGLAATQVGVMHRVLVYRIDPDAPVAVLVNPEVEWRSSETEGIEEGCLSLPGVLAEVERPIHVRVRRPGRARRADPRRGVRPRGARRPARDRPPRRGADPRPHPARRAQAGDARAARAARRRAARRDGLTRRRRACARSTSAPRTSPRSSSTGWPRARTAPALVVTRPDRPRGRGRRLSPPPVAERAAALGLPILQPEALHAPEALAAIAAAEPAVLCVCAFGVLIKEPLLSGYELLNVHPSLLPRWRGAAPVERAIMAGDAETGVSIMRLTAGLDSGPVCLRSSEPIAAEDDYGSLAARLAALGGELLVRALDERPPCRAQDEAGVTYAEKLEPGDRALDPARPAAVLERVVRALRPHVGARLPLPGERLARGRRGAGAGRRRAGSATRPGAGRRRPAPPGVRRRRTLELLEIRPPGGRRMAAADWLRGRPDERLDELRGGLRCARRCSGSQRPRRRRRGRARRGRTAGTQRPRARAAPSSVATGARGGVSAITGPPRRRRPERPRTRPRRDPPRSGRRPGARTGDRVDPRERDGRARDRPSPARLQAARRGRGVDRAERQPGRRGAGDPARTPAASISTATSRAAGGSVAAASRRTSPARGRGRSRRRER